MLSLGRQTIPLNGNDQGHVSNFRPHSNAQHKMRPTVTMQRGPQAVSVC